MSVWVREGHTVVHAREGMSRSTPSENEAKFAIEEMKALVRYINERVAYLDVKLNPGVWKESDDSHRGSAQQQAAYQKEGAAPPTTEGDYSSLFWRPTKSGVGEIVNKSQVPEWVHKVPYLQSRSGVRMAGYTYVLFESGVLWRKKV